VRYVGMRIALLIYVKNNRSLVFLGRTNLLSMWCRDVIAIFDTLFEVSMLRVNKAYCLIQAKGLSSL